MFDKVFTIPPMSDDSMMNLAKEITSDETFATNIVYMANGNPGAMTAIKAMIDKDPTVGPLCLGMLAAFDIRGPMIWLLYKDVCGYNVPKMLELIQDNDKAPRALAALPYGGFKWNKENK